jgi:hypothetical protein
VDVEAATTTTQLLKFPNTQAFEVEIDDTAEEVRFNRP